MAVYNPNAINPDAMQYVLDGPVAGQSLTNSPDQKYPWEQAPEFTSVKAATEKIFLDLLKDDNLETVTTLMANQTPVADIAQVLLFTGFTKGKFNPDLMMSLMEPTMYMLMSIAEKVGIDPVLSRDESQDTAIDDEDTTQIQEGLELAEKRKIPEGAEAPKSIRDLKVANVSPSSVGPDIKKQLETLDTSKLKASLLQKQQPMPVESKGILEKQGA